MFFGIGAYSLALVIYHLGPPSWYHIVLATGVALALSISLALVIAFFSLRVKAIFFAMMTLALAEFADILAVQWYDLTRAEDGVSFKLPGIFSVDWSAAPLFGVEINGRLHDLLFYPRRFRAPVCGPAAICRFPGGTGPQGHPRQ